MHRCQVPLDVHYATFNGGWQYATFNGGCTDANYLWMYIMPHLTVDGSMSHITVDGSMSHLTLDVQMPSTSGCTLCHI